MSQGNELDGIRARYSRRSAIAADRYSLLNPEVLARVQERQRAMVSVLSAHGIHSLQGLDILEIGCGGGANLLELIAFGAEPGRLVGNELLEERVEASRKCLPGAVRLLYGDASVLPLSPASFDIVYQSTVFSSILDDALQARVAVAMWRSVRPGGGVLWYDFTYNNPSNRDVRGVPLARIRALFPGAVLSARRVTLAPPISRRVVRLHPALYGLFNALPLLRTHLLVWVGKPLDVI